jgi:hypothetical protein
VKKIYFALAIAMAFSIFSVSSAQNRGEQSNGRQAVSSSSTGQTSSTQTTSGAGEGTYTGTWELGAQVTMMRFGKFDGFNLFSGGGGATSPTGFNDFRRYPFGVGGRIGYNVTEWATVELEANIFPQHHRMIGGRITEVLGGMKVGRRGEHWGVFGKFRPGFAHFGYSEIICNQIGGTTFFSDVSPCLVRKNHFAMDIGGVVEYYPNTHSFIRVDGGDTRIKFQTAEGSIFHFAPGVTPPLPGTRDKFWTNNLQISVGAGVRY